MKNNFNLFGILVLVIIISFSVVSCSDSGGGGDTESNEVKSIQNWKEAINPFYTSSGIRGIAWGNETFVVGKLYGEIAYSPNGKQWTQVSGNPCDSVLAIAYGNNTFVIGGNSSKIAYSTSNGIFWNNLVLGYSLFNGWYIDPIIWCNNRFVATGADYKIAYSTNVTSWTSATSTHNFDILAFAYGNNSLIAGGVGGKMIYSTNEGSTWNNISDSKFGSNNIYAIAYGNGTFVAGGEYGVITYSTDNGNNWTRVTDSTFGSANIRVVVYGHGIFVAGGSTYVAYSYDGITWQPVTKKVFSGNTEIWCGSYGNGTFVLCNYYDIAYCELD